MILDDKIEFVILFRDPEKNSDWEIITNNFIPKRKVIEENEEQFDICRNLLKKAENDAIDEYGISPGVFYDYLIIRIRAGKIIARMDSKDNTIINYDKPENKDKVK